ncbi:IL17C protein, partial [Buphagus erythrorhynchus]|nr:IL17C protein [Buphagus erythrorhynchus]
QGWPSVLAVLAVLGQCRGLRRPGGVPVPVPVPVPAHPAVLCYSGAELGDECPAQLLGRRLRWDRHVSVQLVPHLEQLEAGGARRPWRHRPHSCSALSLRSALRSEPHERSISPWRYRIDEDENRYPRKLAFAECLCSGCVDVKTGRETTSLNSVTIHQTMLVLRRKPCPGPAGLGLVTLEVDYIRVPVGCTCVLPRTVP